MESIEFLNLVTLKHDVWQELTDCHYSYRGGLECQIMCRNRVREQFGLSELNTEGKSRRYVQSSTYSSRRGFKH